MKPNSVMVWAGVGYNAKAPLVFVGDGVKIDTNVYRKKILYPTRLWAERHYGVDADGKNLNKIFRSNICF